MIADCGAVAALSPWRAPPSDEPALLSVDRAHALRQPALEEALLRPPIGAGSGDPLLPGQDRSRQPSGARRRRRSSGKASVFVPGDRGQGALHSAIGFAGAVGPVAPRLPAKRCRALLRRSRDSLCGDRADGQRAEAMRCQGRSNFFPNLYVADGAAFPSLPSKSITMSLAAHATRVARGAEL